ncbi:MAG: FAD binding domain-containing protein [Thermomicrobiales bacterium]
MIPAKFEYHVPADVGQAAALLRQYDGEAKILAGGQSLIPMMRFRLAMPEHLIDISKLPGLAYIEERDGHLAIGAMTTETELEHNDVVRRRYEVLVDASEVIADPIVRNLATVGGNIAHADPANDHPAVMLALRAEVVTTGPDGHRTIPIDDFFLDTFVTALEPDEILTEIRIPKAKRGSGGAYLKLERKVGDYAIGAIAVNLVVHDGTIAEAGVAMTNVSPYPVRATKTEAALVGKPATAATFAAAADVASQECEPSADNRGPEEYKRAVIRTLAERAFTAAAKRAN